VLNATQRDRSESDPNGAFFGEACSVTRIPNDFLLSRDIIQGVNCWPELRGEGEWGDHTVSLN